MLYLLHMPYLFHMPYLDFFQLQSRNIDYIEEQLDIPHFYYY